LIFALLNNTFTACWSDLDPNVLFVKQKQHRETDKCNV